MLWPWSSPKLESPDWDDVIRHHSRPATPEELETIRKSIEDAPCHFTTAENRRIMAVVEKLEKVAATPPNPLDEYPDLCRNPAAYYNPCLGTWNIGTVRFLASEQDRAVKALEIALPVIKAALDDKVAEEVVNDLTFEIIQTLIAKGVV